MHDPRSVLCQRWPSKSEDDDEWKSAEFGAALRGADVTLDGLMGARHARTSGGDALRYAGSLAESSTGWGSTVVTVTTSAENRLDSPYGTDRRIAPLAALSPGSTAAGGSVPVRWTIFCVPPSQVATTRWPRARLRGTIWSMGAEAPLACIRFSMAAFISAQSAGAAMADGTAPTRQTAAQRRAGPRPRRSVTGRPPGAAERGCCMSVALLSRRKVEQRFSCFALHR